jgi:hypothetical protein
MEIAGSGPVPLRRRIGGPADVRRFMRHAFALLAGVAVMAAPSAFAEIPAEIACHGSPLAGTVRDTTQALIPGAAVTLDGAATATSGADGRFAFPCVATGPHRLAVAADGFAETDMTTAAPHAGGLAITLKPESVETNVDVTADEGTSASTTSMGPTETISGSRLQALADDPDDLQRELQQLAAAGGGNPSNTTIAVDGFQDSSKLPPKSSIAYIKINPDQFSAEYREPPFEGGRVEVYTKPGQTAYHGALFTTNGSPWENARDPFSTSKAAIGKQRYGFELTGPVRKVGSDFALTLEHRSIDNFAVVEAATAEDASGNPVYTSANVATPQRLWLGTARVDWQLGAKNTFITSYSANVNSLLNVGVGGTSLAQAGYASGTYEHMLRFTDVTTVSSHLMHEARLSLRWDGEADAPNSSAAQVQVAGAFTGGGSSLGARRLGEFNVEFDDDAIWTTKKHSFKFGLQSNIYDEHDRLTTNFNGTYIFGGGTAAVLDENGNPIAGQTETISGLEQYRRANLGLAGGAPTAFSNVTGNPQLDFVQSREALFVQDDWNVGKGVHVAMGLRYFLQQTPNTYNGATPRLGILWSPTKDGKWTLHGHVGLFSGRTDISDATEVLRENGVARVTRTAYNPAYNPASGDPYAGTTPIYGARSFAPGITNVSYAIENIGGTRALPHGWNLSLDLYLGRIWNDQRTVNVNSPLNGSPTGPRPLAPNLDLFQVQNSGQGRAKVEFFGLEQHTLKRVQFFLGGVHVDLIDDTDDHALSGPQSAYSNVGEFARRSNQPAWNLFGNATFHLPEKLDLSTDLNAGGDSHYNITTGFDNNGDGNFNDRPQYASPGTPGAVATPFGLLVAQGGAGVFPRNKGVLPWTVHLDMNLQRTFKLTRNAKAEHPQAVTLNLRSSNIINHLNVTSVGGVLGSPLFGVPYAADNGRRVEGGVRYSF